MSYEKLYQISFFVATLFALTTYSSNLETIERVYSAKNEAKTSTGVLETKKDWKEDSKEPIRQIEENLPKIPWNKTKTNSTVISKTANPVKSSSIENTPKVSIVKKVENSFQSGSKIYRNWWNDPRVQYAYNISGGDMDFIKTIEAESKWDLNALWDSGKSFWLCQIHKGYNPVMQKAYRALKTDNEKVKMCYDQYKDWVKRWVIKTRLYWFNVRNKPQNKNSFTIK